MDRFSGARSQSLRSRGPYTPQIIINGRHELVGSRGNQIRKIIHKEKNALKKIAVHKNDHFLKINLPTIEKGQYVLSLFSYGEKHTQSILSGENKGRTVSYTNPVINIEVLGSWDGTAQTLSKDVSQYETRNSFAILAHKDNVTGHIIAAGNFKPNL